MSCLRGVGAVRPAGAALGRLLAQVASASGRGEALAGVWREAVGETVARHSRPRRLEGAVLVVACDAAPWREALQAQAPALLGRLQAVLGDSAVRSLLFQWP